ncbi:serine/threonine-protein kinase VRK1-like isoform X2 [Pseudoliparis swirei]|uniref:serine/threonine-protein kinase VRK1-like isoform X2 n=1 Tax=Pseudoliparis swirei TaxID=2059687 RepID=UPI0024BEECE1|nr:serine/threonine-protein kinase VRK1-like isoform X2 [Pseudoliparis swirei]
MAPPKKRALPKPLPEGFILTDSEKKDWRLGKMIGQGGCGLIYLVEKWRRSRKLDFLGIPTYWGAGLAEHDGLGYRFMVMDRLGRDLQKICERSGGRLKKATALQLGRGLLDVLEYVHENEYVHADIKAANLMLGCRDPEQVYLADYGLSYRYCPKGVHKEYKENPKKGHNGTIEYTSLDAHRGVAPSRRGDLQMLGFCLLGWSCGALPWDHLTRSPAQVQEAKARSTDGRSARLGPAPGGGRSQHRYYLDRETFRFFRFFLLRDLSVPGLSPLLFPRRPEPSGGGSASWTLTFLSLVAPPPDEVAAFLLYVKTLDYEDEPNYPHLRRLLAGGVTGRLDFSTPRETSGAPGARRRDPPTGEKTARGSPEAKAVATEPDEEDEDEEETGKSKPVRAHRRRGPVLPKPPTQPKEEVSRSLRPRAAVAYGEDDSDQEEEEEARPKPIPACYLRGPPIGRPGAPPKQLKLNAAAGNPTASPRPRRDGTAPPSRRGPPPRNEDKDHLSTPRRYGDDRLRWEHRQGGLTGPGQEVGPLWSGAPASWLVVVAVFLFLAVCQSALF